MIASRPVRSGATSAWRGASGGTIAARTAAGFTLIEILLAIFILGIGIISIASLFPAGIAQQRRSVDDVTGPLVANNAIAILRSKARPEDFGSFEQFKQAGPVPVAPRLTLGGDWTWLRPSVLFGDDGNTPPEIMDETGAIDIFSAYHTNGSNVSTATEYPGGYSDSFGTTATPRLHGVPYNRQLHTLGPPAVLVAQRERYYPMPTSRDLEPDGTLKPTYRPQFVWDCMFRRFQGRVQVAIFVYRVNRPGGRSDQYVVAPSPSNEFPPLPVWLNLAEQNTADAWDATGPDGDFFTTGDNAIVCGTALYNPFDQAQSWQEPGQWILDQNGNTHRVLARFADDDFDCDVAVELVRAIPPVPILGPSSNPWYMPYYVLDPWNGADNIVSDIWYLPRYIQTDDGSELSITPVFVTVKDL